MNKIETAFCLGYGSGLEVKEPYSPKQVLESYPDFSDAEVDAFLNGQGDALAKDPFRWDGINRKYINPSTGTLVKIFHNPEGSLTIMGTSKCLWQN